MNFNRTGDYIIDAYIHDTLISHNSSMATSTWLLSGKTSYKDAACGAVKASKKKEKSCVCPICEEPILDKSFCKDGQDSVFCDGQCQAWLDKHCASLSNIAFKPSLNLKLLFYCPHC